VPLVLVLQKEYIDEVEPGRFVHMKQKRLTEWRVEWLEESKRLPESIPEFLKKHMG
jgi:putative acetyltransferase